VSDGNIERECIEVLIGFLGESALDSEESRIGYRPEKLLFPKPGR
jgi:hypothetical protein